MFEMEDSKDGAGNVEFSSSYKPLNDGFNWAKQQAMQYVHFGEDPVGLWYEAALPERDSFCIRDVSHQSSGANILGLKKHTKNMLYQFVKNIDVSRSWCTYWEITSKGEPCPIDYTNDNDFWYNLSANFDIMRTCYLQYLWTGDNTYLNNSEYLNFYKRTFKEYINTWDKDNDGILEYYPEYGRRGIASYNEVGLHPLAGGDMIAAQYAGFESYAKLLHVKGEIDQAKEYEEKMQNLRKEYESKWWCEEKKRFYGAILSNKTFYDEYYSEGNFLPIYFGIIENPIKLNLALQDVINCGVPNVEAKTYLPEIFYRNGLDEVAFKELMELINPDLKRREYPEVSFSVVSAIVIGMMGISAEGESCVSTLSHLSKEVHWAQVNKLPIFNNEISVKHVNQNESSFINLSGDTIKWKAAFKGKFDCLIHNNKKVKATKEIGENRETRSYIIIEAKRGETNLVTLN